MILSYWVSVTFQMAFVVSFREGDGLVRREAGYFIAKKCSTVR